jgi:hypothetical protein
MEHSFSHYILHLEQDFCVIPKDSLSGWAFRYAGMWCVVVLVVRDISEDNLRWWAAQDSEAPQSLELSRTARLLMQCHMKHNWSISHVTNRHVIFFHLSHFYYKYYLYCQTSTLQSFTVTYSTVQLSVACYSLLQICLKLIFRVIPWILISSEFFIYQLMHRRIALKIILKFALKQLLHISVQSR